MTVRAYAYLTGLKQNTVYYYRLVAENKYGRTAGDTFTFTTSNIANPVSKKPSAKTLDASGITKDAAKLNGQLNPNGFVTSYWFEYGKTSDLGNTTNISTDGSGTSNTDVSASISNLDSNTTYYYRFDAYNEFGVALGSVVSFKTASSTGVNVPTVNASSATNVTNTTATFNGTINPNGADTMYWFEYSTDSLFGSVLLKKTNKVSLSGTSGMTNVHADVTGLKNNTNYYFRLVGQNSAGTAKSERVIFSTGTGSSSNTNVNGSVNTSGSTY
jgi:phosphodiesterase/alkaline phosphatase D-like protein